MKQKSALADSSVHLSSLGKCITILQLLPTLPFCVYNLFLFLFLGRYRYKTWKRVIGDSAYRYIASILAVNQIEFVFRTSTKFYQSWTKANGLESIVEEIDEDTRLFWIGDRQLDRVIMYFHGGGFVAPIQDFSLSFWNHTRKGLKHRQNIDVGLVVLNYSLVPTAKFPTQLRQGIAAIRHMVNKGTKPENIVLVGDSAGGNLILQVLAHMLHPVDGVPLLTLHTPINGVYLMSPWVSLQSNTEWLGQEFRNDVISPETFRSIGREVSVALPDSAKNYMESIAAPIWWFKGIDKLVTDVLITAGGDECLKQNIEVVAKKFCAFHDKANFVVQEGGTHNDSYYDFFARESKLCTLTSLIETWLLDRF